MADGLQKNDWLYCALALPEHVFVVGTGAENRVQRHERLLADAKTGIAAARA